VPCIGPTFTDKPNGLIHCFPCTVCDKGEISLKKCTATSDTVCGALEGNYCIDPYEGGCRAAQKHTTCKPGHFIKHPGTDSTDAVCEKCPENSYSVESSTSFLLFYWFLSCIISYISGTHPGRDASPPQGTPSGTRTPDPPESRTRPNSQHHRTPPV
uniref:TNFR-Cys domain-containing protein n=1 Tax=Scleropages formosus TaxID=113540 RepID=A0A8C9SHC6_SCLFO